MEFEGTAMIYLYLNTSSGCAIVCLGVAVSDCTMAVSLCLADKTVRYQTCRSLEDNISWDAEASHVQLVPDVLHL